MTNPVVANPLARTERGMTFGLLLPHFGPHANAERIVGAATRAERLGFDAVWVRDHLLWRPHAHEARSSLLFLEPLITLATLGAHTTRLFLGTSVLIPVRHPLKVAQELAALSYLTGGRVVAGVGAGHDRAELVLGGVEPARKRQAAIEMIRIVKAALSDDHVRYDGETWAVEDATLEPRPATQVPILFGGPSRRAVDVAVEEADGYIVGTQPFLTMDDRLEYLHEREAALGRRLTLVAVPRVLIGDDRAKARASVNVAGMVEDGQHHWMRPPSGWWNSFDDVEGAVFAGEPADIVEGVLKVAERGFDHFVFDVRFQFDRFEALVDLIAERVVPEVRRATAGLAPSGVAAPGAASHGVASR